MCAPRRCVRAAPTVASVALRKNAASHSSENRGVRVSATAALSSGSYRPVRRAFRVHCWHTGGSSLPLSCFGPTTQAHRGARPACWSLGVLDVRLWIW